MFVFLMLYSILIFVVKGFGDLDLLWFVFFSLFIFAYYVKQNSCNERYYICQTLDKRYCI